MLFRILIFILIIFSFKNVAWSQSEQNDLKSVVYLDWANDLFVQTDFYFSNGLELGYISTAKKSLLIRQLELKSFDHFSVIQDFFTPTDINVENIIIGDRPYAAYLVGSYQKHFFSKDKKLNFNPQLVAGILGTAALGRQLQTFTHEISPTSEAPKGWDNQVANDLALNLNMRVEKGFYQTDLILANVFSRARLGTLYTDLSVGARFRIGKFNDFFDSYENLSFGLPKKWQLFFEVKPSLKLVGYNATLQGGVFNDKSPYLIDNQEITRLVGETDFAFTVSYKKFQMNAVFTWISKEFETASQHKWITLKFRWAF